VDTRSLDIGLVVELSAEAFGERGQRTFRLLAASPEGKVSLWLEKEQVVALGTAIEELLLRVPAGASPMVPERPGIVGDLEVRVGALSIGYSARYEGFVLEATEFISAFDLDTIRLYATRSQLEVVRQEIEEIVAAGRHRCLLCGTPLTDGPHFCPPSNGHAHVALSD
jgi:uncharacterized repeat protein (TIGR03847 family)